MSEIPKTRIHGQELVGMEVIDAKGALMGTVKDVGVDLTNKQLILYIANKDKTEIEITASMIQSIGDVILVSRPEVIPHTPTPPPQVISTTIPCPNCNATLPAHAKFCAKCGNKMA